MPAEPRGPPRGKWSPDHPNHKKNTDMRHLLEEFHAFIQAGHSQNTVRTNARVFLIQKIGYMASSKKKEILVARLSGLYNRAVEKGQVGPRYYLADGKRAVIGRWVRDDEFDSVHYIVGLSDAGAEVVNMDTIANSHNYMTVPYEDIRFQDYRTGKELILNFVRELKNACIMARHLYVGGRLKRALFRFRGNDIKPVTHEQQVATIDFPATIRGEKSVKLFCKFVTAIPYDYVLFQNVRFGAPVITRCDTKFTHCSFETVDTPIQKESHTVTFKKCQRVIGQTRNPMDSLEEDAETDDDQPEVVGHETPAQGIEKRCKAAEGAGQLIDLSHSVEPDGGETKSNAPPAPAPTPAPARRQIFSSSDEDDEDDKDNSDDIALSDAEDEEEQEERVTRSYGVPRKDYPFKSCAVIAAASTALSGITTPGIYRSGKGAYVFEHNSTDTEHQRAIEALERVGLTVAVYRGEEDYDIVPMNDLDRRYVEQNCDWCGQDVDNLLEEDDGQFCEACDRILYPESWEK